MDNVSSQIGQNIAREQASVINEKTFQSNNVVGMQTGASQFTKSDNPVVAQQVRNLDKSLTQLPEQQRQSDEKKLKNSDSSADTSTREENFDLSSTIQSAGEFLQARGTAISFSVDEATERQVVTIKDAANGDVIRQIPSEEVLSFAQRMQELSSDVGKSVGVLIDRQA
ncbi:flagellar protein FlaG [Ningiella sp. W23]|uniref:flagellar protein FlaG n=1 Tax=Ningiella sp. W23 TaxID=3023715 RepID=UPI0037565D5E